MGNVYKSLLLIVALSFFCLTFSTLLHAESKLAAVRYYVSNSGNDSNAGTFQYPFLTIQKCATVVRAGESCVIRGGVYRETVTPMNSGTTGKPITYAAYNSEEVKISGTKLITNWTLYAGNIYKSAAKINLGDGKNQVFLNGAMITEARWPNLSVSPVFVKRNNLAKSSGGKIQNANPKAGQVVTGTLTDNLLNQFPTHFFKGTRVNFLTSSLWTPKTGNVIESNNNSLVLNFKYLKSGGYYDLTPNTYYYIWGKLELLDSPGEWYIDRDGNIYIWTPNGDNPRNYNIEVKERDVLFNLKNKQYITLSGLQLFGGTILTSSSTSNFTMQNINMSYISHYQFINNWWEIVEGLTIYGPNSTIKDSVIGYSAGYGVRLAGRDSKLINSIVHNTNYTGGNGATVMAGAERVQILDNTLFNSGSASVLDLRNCSRCTVKRNDVFGAGAQSTDGGAIMVTREWDGNNTEISYNKIHDNHGLKDPQNKYYGTSGIYFEGNVKNYQVYNNIIWNTSAGGITIHPGTDTRIENITIAHNTSYPDTTSNGYSKSGMFDFPKALIGNGITVKNNSFVSNPYNYPVTFRVGSNIYNGPP